MPNKKVGPDTASIYVVLPDVEGGVVVGGGGRPAAGVVRDGPGTAGVDRRGTADRWGTG